MTQNNAFAKLQKDPVLHIEQIQGVETLEDYQKRVCKLIAENDRVVISAVHDIGKTWLMAKIVLWFQSSFPYSKTITTAPTFLQVEKLLWSEINAGYRDSITPLGGEMLTVQWKIDDDWFAIGVSPKDDAGASDRQGAGSRFQGFHAEYILIIFDEATGVHSKRWIQAEGMLTSANVKFIAIGNPTSKNTQFYKCFQSPIYTKVKLTCFDSPNLKANGVRNMSDLKAELNHLNTLDDVNKQKRIKKYLVAQPKLITYQWVMQCALQWGFQHPLFVTKVLGQFPADEDRSMIPLAIVEAAQVRTDLLPDDGIYIGVDPARFGSDSTVITIFEGYKQITRKALVKKDTVETTGHVMNFLEQFPDKNKIVVVVDATGLGSGVVDQLNENQRLRKIKDYVEIREIHFGAQCANVDDKDHYVNLKALMFHLLGEDIKKNLSLLPHAEYLEELPNILYSFDSKGRYVIESKDQYKKRTGWNSPDSADSLALANYGRYNYKQVGEFSDKFVQKGNDMSSIVPSSIYEERW